MSAQSLGYVPYTGGSYTQNFNSLPFTSGTPVNTADPNTIGGVTYTLPGAGTYSFSQTTLGSGGVSISNSSGSNLMDGWWATSSVANKIGAQDGTQTTGGMISFGTDTTGASNRALGEMSTSSSGYTTFGVAIENTGATTLTSFSLSYTGELWRQQTSNVYLNFGYLITPTNVSSDTSGGGALPTTGATADSALNVDFATGTSTGSTDNNTGPLQTSSPSATISGLSWAPDTTLWLTWQTWSPTAGSGSTPGPVLGSGGQGVAIDNLTFSAAAAPPPANVVWAVANGIGTWDTTSGNWTGGNPTANLFKTGDNATFDDSHGSAGGTVTIQAGGVNPGSTTVNTAGTYTFQNTGGDTNGITGNGGLAITGAGKVILTSPNTYTGGSVVSAGTLQISADNQLGASNGTLSINNATLAITGSITGMNRAVTLGANGATIATNGNNLANAGTTAINGLLTTSGSGNVAFNGAVTFGSFGSLSIPAGSLTLGQLNGTITLANGSSINGNLIIGTAGSASATRVNFDNGTFSGSGQIQVQSSGARFSNSSAATGPGTVGNNIFLNSAGTAVTPGVFTALTSSSYYTYSSFVVSIGGTSASPVTTSPLIFTGVISGNSDVVIANSLTGGGGGPTIFGSPTISGGSAGYETYTGNTIFSGNGAVTLINSNVLPVNTNVMDGGSASGAPTLILGGFNQAFASLSDSYTITSPNFLTIENKNATAATLTIGSSQSAKQPLADFSGVIKDGAGGGPLTISKTGTNTVGLAGANTYSGGTTVTAGALVVDGSISGSASVQSGGTLGGIGAVGALAVLSGGTVAPGLEIAGNTIGTLTGAALTWNSGATLAFELSTTGNTSAMLSLGSGALTEGAAGGAFQFNFLGGGDAGQTYNLINFGSTTFSSAQTFSATNLASGLTGYFTLTSGNLKFTATTVGSPLPANVVWAVNNGTGTWDTTTGNWIGGTPTANLYKTTDYVTFDDTHSGTKGGTVTIVAGGVSPNSVTVNTTGVYTFQNTGGDANGISGNGSLTITGAGKVVLTSPNTFTGGVAVNAGTLQISADNQLGSSSGQLNINNATLAITAGITGMNRVLTVGMGGATIATNGFNLAKGGAAAINGVLATTGSGNVAFNGAVTMGVNTTSSQYGSLSIPTGGSVTLGQLSGAISFGNGSLINGNLNIGVAGQTSAARVNFDNSSGSSTGVTGTGNINILSSGISISNASSTTGDTVSANIVLNSSDPSGTFFTKGNVSASYVPGSFVTTIGGTTTNFGPTINSVISGASDVNIAGGGGSTTGGGSGTLMLGGQSTYTGATTFNLNNGTVDLNVNNALPVTTNLIFGTQSGAAGAATLDLNGSSQQVASLSVGTGFTAGATFTLQNSGVANPNVSILTVSGSITPATDFAGAITDGIWGISLVKGGPNTLALSGANSYTGTTTVTGGTVLLDFSQTTSTANILYNQGPSGEVSTPVVSIGGATLELTGGSGLSDNQQLYGLTVSPGGSTIFLNQNGATSLTLRIGAITQTQGGVVNFSVIPLASGVIATTSNANVHGILGPWATVGSGTTLAYATQTNLNGGQIGAFTGTPAASAAALTDTTGAVNYDLATATGTVPGAFSANTIRYLGSGGTTSPGAASFTVNGLMNGGTGLWTIATNPVTIGASQELDIVSNSQGITISSAIKDNSAGASALTTSGTGTVTLAGANTYTGGVFLDGGILNLGAADGAGNGPLGASGSVYFGGGTLQFSSSNKNDYSGRFSTATNQEFSIDTNSQNVTFATALTSVGGSLNKTGAGNLTLSAANTYSGGTTIQGGSLIVVATGSISGSATVQSGGTLGGLGSAGNVEVQSGGSLEPGLTGSGPSLMPFSATSLLWDGGGSLLFDLSTTNSASSELSLGTGVLSEGVAGQYTFNFLGGGKAGQTYDLINFGSTNFSSASAFTATNLGSGLAATFTLTSNEVEVQLAVPEPSAWAALVWGGGMLLGLRRFRRGVRA